MEIQHTDWFTTEPIFHSIEIKHFTTTKTNVFEKFDNKIKKAIDGKKTYVTKVVPNSTNANKFKVNKLIFICI